ncbi:MAG: Uma2 family endonuclease [Gemmataceae bacterium]
MSTTTLLPPPKPTVVPVVLPDDALTEVVYGEVVEKAMSIRTTRIGNRLYARLDEFAEGQKLGIVVCEGMFILDADRNLKRRPDVAFVSAERWPVDRPMPEEGDWQLAPDLAVEVVSSGDSADNLTAKVAEYFDHGVRQVWLIYPALKRVDVYDAQDRFRIVREGDDLETPLVPGWKLALATLFRV